MKVQQILYRNKGHYADVQDVECSTFPRTSHPRFQRDFYSCCRCERMSCKSPRLKALIFAVALLLLLLLWPSGVRWCMRMSVVVGTVVGGLTFLLDSPWSYVVMSRAKKLLLGPVYQHDQQPRTMWWYQSSKQEWQCRNPAESQGGMVLQLPSKGPGTRADL